MSNLEIKLELSKELKQKPQDESKLSFGKIFTDHMFLMNYKTGEGWHNARIVPYGPLQLYPTSMCLHYSQEVFEGLKAYRTKDKSVQLFRPTENFKRLNESNKRLVIPHLDEDMAMQGLLKLLEIEKDWVPSLDGTSLYIRPFIIAIDPYLGVRPSDEYLFCIILSPVGAYYASGLNPVDIYVETKYVRAVKGGTGFVKTGGNYASSLIAQDEAHKQNYSQVLWLDGVERKYIEEVGAMNIFFLIGDELTTPSLEGSILPGITRKSVIEIAKSWGMKVVERKITVEEIETAYNEGRLKEVFGTGTAAVISPVGKLKIDQDILTINNNQIGELSHKLYDTLTGMQWGTIEDKFDWIVKI